jgi:bloom syndrome protein
MAEKLPTTEEEMLALPNITQANFIKYGKQFLKITEKFNILLKIQFAKKRAGSTSGVESGSPAKRPAGLLQLPLP